MKGKTIKYILNDKRQIINTVSALKEKINNEDFEDTLKEEIISVIQQIKDNNYELKQKVKIRLKGRLQTILKNIASCATILGLVVQLIGLLGYKDKILE